MLCNKYPRKIVLSSGLTCKTELTSYGGDGYKFYTFNQHHQFSNNHSHIFQHFSNIIDNHNVLMEVTFGNKLRLLDWKIKT